MSQSANLTIRLDSDTKQTVETLFDGLGMSVSSAVNIFFKQAIRKGGLPFEVVDPFYSKKNQDELARRIADMEAGRNMSVHELIEVDDD